MKRNFTLLFATLFAVAVIAVGIQIPLRAQSAAAPPPAQQTVAQNLTALPAAATAASTEDIRDIRGPKAVPSPELWFLWLAGGAALAALAYGAWRWYRHVSTASKLPYEIALDRLEKARALMTLETAREFSIEVSEIVRSYIEARFHVRVAHQTTEEFLHNLLEPSDALLASHQELLAEFLHHCDLAKFARWILSMEEMEEMHASARVFVLETGKTAAPSGTAKPSSPAPSEQQPVLQSTP
jgi:hypothetical protein